MLLRSAAAIAGVIAVTPGLAQAQSSFPACPSQQKIEQVVGSKGQFVPDECRHLKITRVRSGGTELCILDFRSGTNPGILDNIADATLPTQWWIACDDFNPR
jgi:hypothetical protein